MSKETEEAVWGFGHYVKPPRKPDPKRDEEKCGKDLARAFKATSNPPPIRSGVGW